MRTMKRSETRLTPLLPDSIAKWDKSVRRADGSALSSEGTLYSAVNRHQIVGKSSTNECAVIGRRKTLSFGYVDGRTKKTLSCGTDGAMTMIGDRLEY